MPSSESRRSSPARVWLRPGRRSARFGRRPAVRPRSRRGQQLPSPGPGAGAPAEPAGARRAAARAAPQSGLTPDQVRSRLRAAGLSGEHAGRLRAGRRHDQAAQFGPRTLDAVRALGVLSADGGGLAPAGGLDRGDVRFAPRGARLASSCSVRTRSAPIRWRIRSRSSAAAGSSCFGVETFRRATTRFQPAQAGPVDENYRLGPGDMLVLILTGDVERPIRSKSPGKGSSSSRRSVRSTWPT